MAKILINILSEQTLPNYIATKETKPEIVFCLATEDYYNQIDLFKKTTNVEHKLKKFEAYDIETNFDIIQKLIHAIGSGNELIVNYTGGTKVMVISVILKILLSTNQKLSFIYVNTFGNSIEYLELSEDKQLTTHSSNINTKIYLETYVNLKGEKLKFVEHKLSDRIIERFPLSQQLLIDSSLSKIFNKQKTFFEGRSVKEKNELHHSNFTLSWNKTSLELKTKNSSFSYPHNDGGVYFTGGWLEEYVFYKLYKSSSFDKVVANVKFNFTSFKIINKAKKNSIVKNEMDVVVTKGLKTVFVECKAGKVTQDYVYKLKSIRDHFLGTFGLAVLVTKFKQQGNIVEKCKDANILLVSSEDILNIDRIIENII